MEQTLATHDLWAPAAAAERATTFRVSINPIFDDAQAASLWADANIASVFNHPAWWRAAIQSFGDDRQLRVFEIHDGGRLVAIWPFWLKRLDAREAFARVLEPVGARVTDYCQPLTRQGYDIDTLFKGLVAQAASSIAADTMLFIPKVPDRLPVAAGLAQADPDRRWLIHAAERPCPVMPLPTKYDSLEQGWSKNHRNAVRRRIKRLEAVGRLEFWVATSRAEIEASLPRLYAMHVANWRARVGFSEFENGPMRGFVDRLAAALPLELICATEVRIDGNTIASHFGFQERDALLWYKPTFDIAWSTYAPGRVMTALTARWAIAQGLKQFDFMQGTESYKLQWTSITKPTMTHAVARPITYPLWAWNTKIRKLSCEYRY